jgi:hypothetical protein
MVHLKTWNPQHPVVNHPRPRSRNHKGGCGAGDACGESTIYIDTYRFTDID